MGNIQTLAPHVANLIAAGEVVERPGAVLKELTENAIDAGATQVTARITNGGMGSVRVTDNGSGIEAGEVKTAFLRHATSKIRSEFDLEAIGTLGFRGEALAAIAAVSRVEMLTRTQDASMGVFLTLEGGVPDEPVPRGCPQGTDILVRDLFYNTPARLKFIKKDQAEGMYAAGLMQKVALSHPEVSIRFFREGKEEFSTPGDGDLGTAIYSVLGRDLFGSLMGTKGTWDGVAVEGFVSLPSACKGTRAQQHFFLNGRAIRSQSLSAALEGAYRNQKMVGKFPACVLHIRVKPSAVDVNVHPTKTEVKFANERQMFHAVYETVRCTLEEDQTRTQIALSPEKEASSAQQKEAIQEKEAERQKNSKNAFGYQYKPLEHSHPLLWDIPPVKNDGAVADGTRVPYQMGGSASGGPVLLVDNWRRPNGAQPKEPPASAESAHGQSPAADLMESVWEGSPAIRSKTGDLPSHEPVAPEETPEPDRQTHSAPAPWKWVGEAFDTYVIVSQGERVFFIDKHAAHERILFDQLTSQGHVPMVQQLIHPLVWSSPGEEGGALLQQVSLLGELGFEIEDFGDGSLLIRGVPGDLDPGQAENTLAELAEILHQGGTAESHQLRERLLETMACKMAIKGGEKTDPKELTGLVDAVLSGAVKYCPHGRPVTAEISRKELEKQFRRT